MDPDQAQEMSERDQLWASLRALRPHIDRIAAGDFESPMHQQVVMVLARVVAAEIDYRARDAAAE